MSKREQGRVLAVQALYQWDLRGDEFTDQVAEFLAESTQDSEVFFFARELTLGAWDFRGEADRWIRSTAAHWEMNRMAAVDRNILRLAIYEMLGRHDIPPRVAIDQAIELAKRFSSAESGAFVNGILDHVLREARPEAVGVEGPDGAAAEAGSSGTDYPDIRNWDEE
jgi:transcription antitermination factor NusB